MGIPAWSRYQEEAAEHFRRLGLAASTNVTLAGVRSTHAIDVVVRFERAGIDHLWVVECKDTARPVSKDKVLVLRAILDDVGAERGILLCENGFQSGAKEVAQRTNVVVTSLAELADASRDELFSADVAALESRLRALGNTWSSLHGPVRRHAGSTGGSRLGPKLSREVWPEGPTALTGRLSFLREAVQRARFGEFPVAVIPNDSEEPMRVGREAFFDTLLPLVERLEGVIAQARHPDD